MGSSLPLGAAASWPNALLARLPPDESERVRARSTVVELDLQQTVEDRDSALAAVHFPFDAVLSVVDDTVDGEGRIEIHTIGNEGVAGTPAFLGATTNAYTTMCQVPGRVLRLPVRELREMLADDGALHRLFQLNAQVTIAQLSRGVVCRQLHHAEQRTARWLLTTHDRVGHDEFLLTQEFLAEMLGVRRSTVSEAAGRFRRRGLIRYRRGRMTVVDRAGLEAASCACYAVLREQTAALLDSDADL